MENIEGMAANGRGLVPENLPVSVPGQEYLPRTNADQNSRFEFENHLSFLSSNLSGIAQRIIGGHADEGPDPNGEKYGAAWQEVRNEGARLADYFIKRFENPATRSEAIKQFKYFVDQVAQGEANSTASLIEKGRDPRKMGAHE